VEESIIWFLIITGLLLVVGAFLFQYIIPGAYYALAALALLIYYALDQAFSVAIFPTVPWLMWLFWGAMIGAALGFWTVAPVYGLRKYRPLIIFFPAILMLFVALLRLLFLLRAAQSLNG
jgi:hypothetical protein